MYFHIENKYYYFLRYELGYLFCIQYYVHANSNLPIYPSPQHFPFGNHKFGFKFLSLFLFCKQVILYRFY